MDYFKDLIISQAVKYAVKKLILKFAWMSWGPIPYLVMWLAEKVITETYEFWDEHFDLKQIAFKNKEAHTQWVSSNVQLAVIAMTAGENSDEFKKAREYHKKAIAHLAGWNI